MPDDIASKLPTDNVSQKAAPAEKDDRGFLERIMDLIQTLVSTFFGGKVEDKVGQFVEFKKNYDQLTEVEKDYAGALGKALEIDSEKTSPNKTSTKTKEEKIRDQAEMNAVIKKMAEEAISTSDDVIRIASQVSEHLGTVAKKTFQK